MNLKPKLNLGYHKIVLADHVKRIQKKQALFDNHIFVFSVHERAV